MNELIVPIGIGATMGLVLACAVLGLGIAFRLFHFPDLTVEGSVALGAATFAVLVKSEVSILIAVALACLAGSLAGAATATAHSLFGINKFLAGIIVIAISYSLSLRIMGGANIGLLRELATPGVASWLGTHSQIRSLFPIIAIGVVALIYGLHSRLGIRLRASGSNPVFAESLGLRPILYTAAGLALTNGLSAFSGVLLAWYQGFADAGLGQGVLVLALASLTIGESLIPRRRLSYPAFIVLAATVGSAVYQILLALAVRAGVPSTDLKLATAVLVLIVAARRGHLRSESSD